MGKSTCVICGAQADQLPAVGSFVGFDCLDCRNYSINKDVLRSVIEDGRSFYVAQTRKYLEEKRVHTDPHLSLGWRFRFTSF